VNHGPVNPLEPEVITLQDVLNQTWNDFEEHESKLIRINNVTINATGNFASGTNYNITDPTGSITQGLRIDNDVNSIIGQPIPTAAIDIIGILGQYDPSVPHSTGYQLMPRYFDDLLYDNSPLILNPVIASNITPNSFTVYFNTARNGDSQVKYGLTPDLELDSVIINDDTTYHVVPVTGLEESTLYYYRAYSENEFGTSFSSLNTATTSSSNPSVGTINVYFNFSVDTTVAIPGNAAKGNVSFEQKLLERINGADYSIDMAVYSFDGLPNIANALIAAKNRGVKIRVVYENRNTQSSMLALINAGIPVLKRSSGLDGIMHNKFFIFDARDTVSVNDWLWTGSWNITSIEVGWKNNVVEINDPAITTAYKVEFEEMWGSSDDTPNPSLAKFGNQKTDNTPHFFNIGGRDVRLYFSPSDGTTAKIIDEVNKANHNIYFALYAFTRSDIANAIYQRHLSGVSDIRGLIDQKNTTGSQFDFLSNFAEIYQNNNPALHHKYAIFDASFSESSPVAITGSHNWSSAAENSNDENSVFLYDVFIANQYMQEFKSRYNQSGGTGTFIIPFTDVDEQGISEFSYSLHQNFPNPFNPVTTIRFEVPHSQKVELKVFDMLGREVRELYNDIAPAGIIAIDFKADNLASGVYIYRLKTENFVDSKKLILLK
jgi:phosphatidylserine/phosphatidylglycerophosphate/cardiolipin synthase-like enzyme